MMIAVYSARQSKTTITTGNIWISAQQVNGCKQKQNDMIIQCMAKI